MALALPATAVAATAVTATAMKATAMKATAVTATAVTATAVTATAVTATVAQAPFWVAMTALGVVGSEGWLLAAAAATVATDLAAAAAEAMATAAAREAEVPATSRAARTARARPTVTALQEGGGVGGLMAAEVMGGLEPAVWATEKRVPEVDILVGAAVVARAPVVVCWVMMAVAAAVEGEAGGRGWVAGPDLAFELGAVAPWPQRAATRPRSLAQHRHPRPHRRSRREGRVGTAVRAVRALRTVPMVVVAICAAVVVVAPAAGKLVAPPHSVSTAFACWRGSRL